jgi:hypothetical protein
MQMTTRSLFMQALFARRHATTAAGHFRGIYISTSSIEMRPACGRVDPGAEVGPLRHRLGGGDYGL